MADSSEDLPVTPDSVDDIRKRRHEEQERSQSERQMAESVTRAMIEVIEERSGVDLSAKQEKHIGNMMEKLQVMTERLMENPAVKAITERYVETMMHGTPEERAAAQQTMFQEMKVVAQQVLDEDPKLQAMVKDVVGEAVKFDQSLSRSEHDKIAAAFRDTDDELRNLGASLRDSGAQTGGEFRQFGATTGPAQQGAVGR